MIRLKKTWLERWLEWLEWPKITLGHPSLAKRSLQTLKYILFILKNSEIHEPGCPTLYYTMESTVTYGNLHKAEQFLTSVRWSICWCYTPLSFNTVTVSVLDGVPHFTKYFLQSSSLSILVLRFPSKSFHNTYWSSVLVHLST